MPSLKVKNIRAEVEGIPVLNGISLEVKSDETVALIGRNGAGKTTTFRVILGLQPPTAGGIYINGKNITPIPTNKRHSYGLSLAPQDMGLFKHMSVEENLQVAAWGCDIPEDKYTEITEHIFTIFPEMKEFIGRPAGQLSGGQQRMVAIARALITDPKILLLDEPFEGLAPNIRNELKEGIKNITYSDLSIFIGESNIKQTKDIADRLYLIERGEIISEIKQPSNLENDDKVQQIFGV